MSIQLHNTLMSQYKHGTASGIGSVSYDSVANCVTPEVVIYGKCIQDGTPTPDVPVYIIPNNNLYNVNGRYHSIPTLYAVGDVRDEYYPQTGKIIRRCKKHILSSSDTITTYGTITFIYKGENPKTAQNTSICSHSKNVMSAWGANFNGVYGVHSDNNITGYKYFRPPNDSIDTVDKFKAWLDEQKAAGKPVILVYQLASPVIEYVDPVQITSVRGTNIIEETDLNSKINGIPFV